MNVTKPPFDNLKVRQAVACAIPYRKIMDAVLFGLAKPMFGAAPRSLVERDAMPALWPTPIRRLHMALNGPRACIR